MEKMEKVEDLYVAYLIRLNRISRVQEDYQSLSFAIHNNPNIEQEWKEELEKLQNAATSFAEETNNSEFLNGLKLSYAKKEKALRENIVQKAAVHAQAGAELAAALQELKNFPN